MRERVSLSAMDAFTFSGRNPRDLYYTNVPTYVLLYQRHRYKIMEDDDATQEVPTPDNVPSLP